MRNAAALLILALLTFTACSSHKTTVQTDQGAETVTTSNDNKTTTVETKEGKVTVGGDVDEAKLGAPVYPGASKNDAGAYSVQSSSENASMAAFKTSDTFDRVYEYYKSKMPAGSEKMKMSNEGESMASFVVQDPSKGETTVMITAKGSEETQILITHKDAK